LAKAIENITAPRPPLPVLFVDHAPALGGAEHSLLLLLEEIDRQHFVPILATQPGELAAAARRRDVRVYELPLVQLRQRANAPWRAASGVAALLRVVRRERVAVVYANTVRASIYAAAAARLSGRPHVWHVRDFLSRATAPPAVSASSSAVIAVSAAVARRLPAHPRLDVIPNGVRRADFEKDQTTAARALRARWNIAPDATLVAHVARLAPWKGQHDVIAAAEIVLRTHARAAFVLVGGDIFGDATPYERELREDIARRGLGDRVHLAGQIDDVPAALASADLVVHASDAEPFGRILIEAGAARRPVVAYASGAVDEIVVDGETGVLVRPGNPPALAAGIARLLGDAALRQALGTAAAARVAAHFDARDVARRVEAVLLGACSP
jgi:glycosyltransferase involved in cell wall biosynthesis